MKIRKSNKKGFTLIELLAVIVIMGILINNGTINGDAFLSATDSQIRNNNTINGNVKATVTGGTFTNNGTVTGTIS